jgi:hypothetical protein
MLKEHPNVVMLDCTYKTNKFNMPFLYIVGVTSIDLTYNIAFCLLLNKKKDTYNFAVLCLKALFEQVGVSPRIFITNYEVALKSRLKEHYLEVP